jgi:hypothetical protein
MFFNRKLKEENIRLQCRVKELEERLCPCEQHDWVLISTTYDYDGYGYSDARNHYKCRRCGKEVRD